MKDSRYMADTLGRLSSVLKWTTIRLLMIIIILNR